MKIIYLLILLSICIPALSQEDSKVSLGILLNPNYSYRSLTSTSSTIDDTLITTDMLINRRDSMENAIFSYNIGLAVKYSISNRLWAEFNTSYRRLGESYQVEMSGLVFGDQLDDRLGLANTNATPTEKTLDYFKRISTYNFVATNFKINYLFLDKKIRLFGGIGIAPNFFISSNAKVISYYKEGDKEIETYKNDPKQFNSLLMDANAELGSEFDLGDKSFLRTSFTFNHMLTPLVDAPVNQFQYAIGLNVGFFLKL